MADHFQSSSKNDDDSSGHPDQLPKWPLTHTRCLLSGSIRSERRLSMITFSTSSSVSSGSAFIDYIHSRKDITGRRINPKMAKLRNLGVQPVTQSISRGTLAITGAETAHSLRAKPACRPPPPLMHRRDFSHRIKSSSQTEIPSIDSPRSSAHSVAGPLKTNSINSLDGLDRKSGLTPSYPSFSNRQSDPCLLQITLWEIWDQLDSPNVFLVRPPPPVFSRAKRLPRPIKDRFMWWDEIVADSERRSLIHYSGFKVT
jgi:hypothetical protein